MNALGKFVADMTKFDEISALENEQQEQIQQSETKLTENKQQEQIQESKPKLNEDEQRRFSLVLPPLTGKYRNHFIFNYNIFIIEIPKKKEETTSAYRQWKVDDLTDDDDDDEKVNENHSKQTKTKAFEKFIARRPISMPPPTFIPSQTIKSSPIKEIVNLTDDESSHKNRSEQIKTKVFDKCLSQHPVSTPPVPILSQKINSSRTQTIIDLTDDDDDFIQSTSTYSYRPEKKFKST